MTTVAQHNGQGYKILEGEFIVYSVFLFIRLNFLPSGLNLTAAFNENINLIQNEIQSKLKQKFKNFFGYPWKPAVACSIFI